MKRRPAAIVYIRTRMMMGEREREREKEFRALDDRGSIFPVLWALIDRTVVRKGRYENVNCFQGNSPHLRSHTQHRRARLYTFTYIITHQFANVGPRMREKGSSHFLTSQIGWPTKKVAGSNDRLKNLSLCLFGANPPRPPRRPPPSFTPLVLTLANF